MPTPSPPWWRPMLMYSIATLVAAMVTVCDYTDRGVGYQTFIEPILVLVLLYGICTCNGTLIL